MRLAATLATVAAAALFGTFSPTSAASLFHEIAPAELGDTGFTESARYFALDPADMRITLKYAPRESFTEPVDGLRISLPLPGGITEEYEVWESPVMHPDLAAKYPEIKTYVGRGIDDATATARLDVTPHGFHAMVRSPKHATIFIDPIAVGDDRTYVCYSKRNREDVAEFKCGFDEIVTPAEIQAVNDLVAEHQQRSSAILTGEELRTYRTAIAATGEYTNFHGGTVALALAAINTSLNRVTGVYETDVSVRMELIPNNNLIIYTNSATDPYTNNNGFTMLGQNQANLDSVIGSANYDIGHVFSTGGGGVAGLGVVCRANNKARGVTGLNNPVGDVFDIDYVSHEMGHQYSATHTFNGDSGSCAGGNRTAATAWEPGSGSTIMAYAGICGADNVANSSHDNFHTGSIDQIVAYTQSGFGNNCPVTTATGNTPPVAVAGNVGFTIPISTPFILFGSASDVDTGDVLTYDWEEFDLGPAGDPDNPAGNAPIFRCFGPKDRLWRMFPRKVSVRNNTTILGELLPTYSRPLRFRFTVRDGNGGVDADLTTLTVDENAGPFLVTSIDATPWVPGEMRLVTWDVANTDAAPVSCANVNILLSLNDGVDYTENLALNTPNDGSELVVVPALPTLEARIQIEAADNVFLDMNDDAFEITTPAVGVEELASAADALSLDVRPNPFSNRTSVSFALSQAGPARVRVYDAGGREIVTLSDAVRAAGRHTVEWNGTDSAGAPVATGVYFIRMESKGVSQTTRAIHLR